MSEDQFKSSSFIPKGEGGAHYQAPDSSDKPSSPSSDSSSQKKSGPGAGLLLTISISLTVIAGLAAGGVFFYTQYLGSNLSSLEQDLAQAQAAFEPEIIDELETIDTHISSTQEILNEHTAVTPVFDVVESVTLASIQLTGLSVSSRSRYAGDSGGSSDEDAEPVGDVAVSMTGIAPDYAAVALQSQSLSENDEVMEPVLSEFSLNEQGDVEFSISFSLDENYMSYEQTI